MTTAEQQAEALTRAVSGLALTNYPAIYQGFIDKGIPEDQIKPRENVFTFNAWKALGRYVRKGEHGVRILTFIETKHEDKETGEVKVSRRPWSSTVFHVSQTEPGMR
jgi:antirestriction factor ArdC-like protein